MYFTHSCSRIRLLMAIRKRRLYYQTAKMDATQARPTAIDSSMIDTLGSGIHVAALSGSEERHSAMSEKWFHTRHSSRPPRRINVFPIQRSRTNGTPRRARDSRSLPARRSHKASGSMFVVLTCRWLRRVNSSHFANAIWNSI